MATDSEPAAVPLGAAPADAAANAPPAPPEAMPQADDTGDTGDVADSAADTGPSFHFTISLGKEKG